MDELNPMSITQSCGSKGSCGRKNKTSALRAVSCPGIRMPVTNTDGSHYRNSKYFHNFQNDFKFEAWNKVRWTDGKTKQNKKPNRQKSKSKKSREPFYTTALPCLLVCFQEIENDKEKAIKPIHSWDYKTSKQKSMTGKQRGNSPHWGIFTRLLKNTSLKRKHVSLQVAIRGTGYSQLKLPD